MAGTGIEVIDYIPEVVNPPLAIVSAGDPYVQESFDEKTFDSDYKVNMKVRLVASPVQNEVATDDLDDYITATLIALNGSWETEVSQPFMYEVNGYVYLAADLNLSTTITIK